MHSLGREKFSQTFIAHPKIWQDVSHSSTQALLPPPPRQIGNLGFSQIWTQYQKLCGERWIQLAEIIYPEG